jgi:endonuclease/exonuclease/phosphatase family metal-dependent hydrolase
MMGRENDSLDREADSAYSADSSPRESVPLRMMQFNIHGWRDTQHRDNIDDVVEHVKTVSPDILILNEVLHPYANPSDDYLAQVRAGKGNGFAPCNRVSLEESYLHRLAIATGLEHYVFGEAVSDGYFGQYGYGNAILSKSPLSDPQHLVIQADQLEYSETRRIEAEDRGVTSADLSAPHAPGFRVFTTHLDQLDESLRLQQIQLVLKQITDSPQPSMLVGDLNTYQAADYSDDGWDAIVQMWERKGWGEPPKRSATLEALAASELKDAHYLCERNSGTFAKPTCWTIEPLFRIDYALLDARAVQDWEVVQCDREIEAECSDHFPIVVEMLPMSI